jgi:hypothetical protein
MIEHRIHISPSNLLEVKRLLDSAKKIAAIKLTRAEGKLVPGREVVDPQTQETRISHLPGLREAKEACENLVASRKNGISHHKSTSCVFLQRLKISKIIVEGETGNIELDLDQLQLRCLDGLSQGIPLSQIAEMTKLITFVREWQGE